LNTAAAIAGIAVIITMNGDVKIQEAGTTQWYPAEAGMSVSDGDTIRTGKGASLELSMDDGDNVIVSLYENSTAIMRGSSLSRIDLPEGRIRSYVKKLNKGSSFEIKTPTVIAGARGSSWDVEASGAGFSTVEAFEDVIFVKSVDEKGNIVEEKDLQQDYSIKVDKNRRFGAVSKIKASDKEAWKKWKAKKRVPRNSIKKKPRPAMNKPLKQNSAPRHKR